MDKGLVGLLLLRPVQWNVAVVNSGETMAKMKEEKHFWYACVYPWYRGSFKWEVTLYNKEYVDENYTVIPRDRLSKKSICASN